MKTKKGTYAVGQRIELHPACAWWMRGARYGEVVKVHSQRHTVRETCDPSRRWETRYTYSVCLDVTNKLVRLLEREIANEA